jgi:SAM-dependent methyltransferase
VRCPWCLHGIVPGAGECLNASRDRLGTHWDIDGRHGVAARSVWRCPSAEAFFAHPPLKPAELKALYAHYHGARGGQYLAARARAQSAYIEPFLRGANRANATVLEVGCATGALLAALAAPGRRMLCFEQSGAAAVAEKSVRAAGARSVAVIRSPWDASSPLLAPGVDLFVSSHALEHMADLCTFLREVYAVLRSPYSPISPPLPSSYLVSHHLRSCPLISPHIPSTFPHTPSSQVHAVLRPGGLFFSELPNNHLGYVKWQLGGNRALQRTANFHVTQNTPQSMLAYMEATGFRLVDLQLVGSDHAPEADGRHIRFVWGKPRHDATRGSCGGHCHAYTQQLLAPLARRVGGAPPGCAPPG